MPNKWYKRILRDSRLTVYNDAGAWKGAVTRSIREFNNLPFGVTMEASDNHINANIVVRFSQGSGKDKDFSWAIANFDAKSVHGQTSTNVDHRGEVDKAVVFLPGRLSNINDDLKTVIIVHELIHACGLDDHDPVGGVMYAKFQLHNGRLQEPPGGRGLTIQGMPPIRVGNWTLCQMANLWNKTAPDHCEA